MNIKVRKPKPSTTWCSVVLQKALPLACSPSPFCILSIPSFTAKPKRNTSEKYSPCFMVFEGIFMAAGSFLRPATRKRPVSSKISQLTHAGTFLKPPHRGIAQRQWKQQSIQGMGSKEGPLQLRHKPQNFYRWYVTGIADSLMVAYSLLGSGIKGFF